MTMDNSMKIRKDYAWHLIASALFALVLSSCSSSLDSSLDIDRRTKFVDVLMDIQLLEAAYKQKLMPKESADSLMVSNYKLIFKEHQITQAQFNSEFDFWKTQPEQMAIMYAEMAERLNKLDSELRAKSEGAN